VFRQFRLVRLAIGAPARIHRSVDFLVGFVSRCRGPGTVQNRRLRWFLTPSGLLRCGDEATRAITPDYGQDLERPIAERVVKPDALVSGDVRGAKVVGRKAWVLTHVQDQRRMKLALAWTRSRPCSHSMPLLSD